MNTYDLNDETYTNSEEFKNFMKVNSARGMLRIRAYAASQAIPVSGVKIVVSTIIADNRVIFFEGYTDESGVIEKISLPAPPLNVNNLDVPNNVKYEISATYEPDNIKMLLSANIYEDLCVIQNISIVPNMNLQVGGY